MPLEIVRNDIVKMNTDAIVNAAAPDLKMGGGVCGAIFTAAGADALSEACAAIGGCAPGNAVITPGFDLPARYIIHAVGPVWHGGDAGEESRLHDCYINSLKLARKFQCASVAFPLISSGIFGYPKDQAMQVAISAIYEFLTGCDMNVFLVVYDKNSFEISEKLFASVGRYIDDNYVADHNYNVRYNQRFIKLDMLPLPDMSAPSSSVEAYDRIEIHPAETFSQMVLRLIDRSGMTDAQVYKRVNLDRKLFSKIRSNKDYNPSKNTAILLGLALRLNLDEALDLLGKAGYTLSKSRIFDLVIEYFFENEQYDIYEVNKTLLAFDQSLLGA